MTTLTLNRLRTRKKKRPKEIPFSPQRPYIDHGKPGPLRYGSDGKILRTKEPPPVLRVTLTVEAFERRLRRHNALPLVLTVTDRILLRWGESGGNGLPNSEAEIREMHYDPLPPDLQEKVDNIVTGSPWEFLTRRWYRMSITPRELAAEMRIGKTQLYADWKSSLWYYRGRFEAESLHE